MVGARAVSRALGWFLFLAIFAAIAGWVAEAEAQANCALREVLIDRLKQGFGEEFAGGGMQNARRIVEVWASEERGTWTILLTRADGTSCVIASGTAWRKGLPGGVAG